MSKLIKNKCEIESGYKTKDLLELAYQKFGNYRLVAEHFNTTKRIIQTYMDKFHIKRQKNKNSCNEAFFSQDNEDSFYWAGFIAADGCVYKRKMGESYGLRICLAYNDLLHLINFKRHINSSATITNYGNNIGKYCALEITSKNIFNDLARFNIVPRKSLIYTFPEWMKVHPLKHHFMRGYNDGDGCFCILSKNNKTKIEQITFSLRGTKKFLTTYRSILEDECKIIKRETEISVNKIGILQYGGNRVCEKIGDFLYDNSSIYLERKKIIYDKVKI